MTRQKSKKSKKSKRDETDASTSINEFLDTMLKDDNSIKSFLAELLKREVIMGHIMNLIKPEVENELNRRISTLEDRIDDLEQYSRRTCLKFAGIKETSEENTDDIVLDLINSHILSGGENKLSKKDIGRSHRVGKPGGRYDRDIIVRFISYRDRALVYGNKKRLKDINYRTKTKIYINEALTRKRADIYKKTRQLLKDNLIKNCWTMDGRIYIRNLHDDRKILINSEYDIQKYRPSEITSLSSRESNISHIQGANSTATNNDTHAALPASLVDTLKRKQPSLMDLGLTSTPIGNRNNPEPKT